jgi:hypothetical protein
LVDRIEKKTSQQGHVSGAKVAAAKGPIWVQIHRENPAGAEADADFVALAARLKSCPDASGFDLGFSSNL